MTTEALSHICHAIRGNHAVLMVAGGTLGCFFHCVGTCALCLSGGTALGTTFYKLSQLLVRHIAPTLLILSMPSLLLTRSLSL